MTTFQDSEDSVFKIDDSGDVLRDLSPYIIAVDGLPGPRKLSEATALGDGGTMWHPGLEDVPFTLELYWSKDTDVGPDTVLGPLRTHTAAVDFEFGPEGGAENDIKYSGKCWVRNFTTPVRVGGLVFAKAELQVNGKVARGAFPA